MSIEFGIVAAMRRASASTNGKPGNDAAVLAGGNGLGAHSSLLEDSRIRDRFRSAAHHRNGDTNGRACVPTARLSAA